VPRLLRQAAVKGAASLSAFARGDLEFEAHSVGSRGRGTASGGSGGSDDAKPAPRKLNRRSEEGGEAEDAVLSRDAGRPVHLYHDGDHARVDTFGEVFLPVGHGAPLLIAHVHGNHFVQLAPAPASAGGAAAAVAEEAEEAEEEEAELEAACGCGEPDADDDMIQCDDCGEWLHYRCAGLSRKRVPSGSWTCKDCTGASKKPAKGCAGSGAGGRRAVKRQRETLTQPHGVVVLPIDCGKKALTDAAGSKGFSLLARLAGTAAVASRAAAAALATTRAAPSSSSSSSSPPPSSSAAGPGQLFDRAQIVTPLDELLELGGADGNAGYVASCRGNNAFTARAAAAIAAPGPDTLLRRDAVAGELPSVEQPALGWLELVKPLLTRRGLAHDQRAARIRSLASCYSAGAALSMNQHGSLLDPAAVALQATFPVEREGDTTWALAKPGARKGNSPDGVAVCESMVVDLALCAALEGLSVVKLDASNTARNWASGTAAENDDSAAVAANARDVIDSGYAVVAGLGADSFNALRAAMGSGATDVSERFGVGEGYVYYNGHTVLFGEVHPQNLLATKGSALNHAQRYDVFARGLRAAAGLGDAPLSLVGHVLRQAEGLTDAQTGAHVAAQQTRAGELRSGKSLPFTQQPPSIQLTAAGAGHGDDEEVATYQMRTLKAQRRWRLTGASAAAVVASMHGIAGGKLRLRTSRAHLAAPSLSPRPPALPSPGHRPLSQARRRAAA